jgi:hypothetical protein
MMFLSDKKPFFILLKSTAEFYSKSLTENQLETYWNLLKSQPFQAINSAFTAHMLCTKRGQYIPTPADILAKSRFTAERKTADIGCQYTEGTHPCGRRAVVNARIKEDVDNYLCDGHWQMIRPKTEIELKLEKMIEQFIQWAKDAGMTGKEFFDDWYGKQDKKTQDLADKIKKRYEATQA